MNNFIFRNIVKGIGRVAGGNSKESINTTEVSNMKKSTITAVMTVLFATVMLSGGWAQAGTIVTDFSNFVNENIDGDNLSFSSDSGSSDLDISGPGNDSSTNYYSSAEFPKYDTAGMRTTVDLDSVGVESPNFQAFGLIVADSTTTNETNVIEYQMWSDLDLRIRNYRSGGTDQKWVDNGDEPSSKPFKLFMETNANGGWDFGFIESDGTEHTPVSITDPNDVFGSGNSLATDGSVVGLNARMNHQDGTTQTWTTSFTAVPEPSSLALLGLAGLLLMKRRRV